MSPEQLSKILRRARSEMPRRTSAEAYAQMDELMGVKTTTSTSPASNGKRSARGRKSAA